MATRTAALRYLFPGSFAIVMGLAGLALAWHRAVPLMGTEADAAALAIGLVAAAVFITLCAAMLMRHRHHPEAWAEDMRHPLRHTHVAALPVAAILLATWAVAMGMQGAPVGALWWAGSLGQLFVTVWVLQRWWRGNLAGGLKGNPLQAGGLQWSSVTPALIIPVVGNVLVPLAGVTLGHAEWSAAQLGIGLLFWPVVLSLLGVRIAVQGAWAERLLPANFILLAPPAAVGLSLIQFDAPVLVAWGLWGMGLATLLWLAPLLPRIATQPIGLAHWSMTFPVSAFAALTLRLAPGGVLAVAGMALLALATLLVAALGLATVRGLRSGEWLAPEVVPIAGSAIGPEAG